MTAAMAAVAVEVVDECGTVDGAAAAASIAIDDVIQRIGAGIPGCWKQDDDDNNGGNAAATAAAAAATMMGSLANLANSVSGGVNCRMR